MASSLAAIAPVSPARGLPDQAHGLGKAGGIPTLHVLHARLREERPLAHDLYSLRLARPAVPVPHVPRPPCPARRLCLLAPLKLDDAAHDVRRALRRLNEAEGPAGLARGHEI